VQGSATTTVQCPNNAVMSLPAPGSTLGGSAVTFTWSAGTGASAYWLDVGTVQGQGNIFGQNVGLVTSQMVSGIPVNGGAIYVRLWTQINGNWSNYDYTYTAASGTKAVMSTPVPGSVLSDLTVTFTWSAGVGASAYWLDVGTVQGQGNIFGHDVGLATSQMVGGIATGGGDPIYVRLWTQINGVWSYNDYTYTELGGSKAVMSTPVPGSTLSGPTVTFTWASGLSASAYWLDVGTVQGQGNIYAATTAFLSQTVSGIPTNGATIYVRLWTRIYPNWGYSDYTYTAASGTKAVMSTPVPGSTLSGSTVTFTWSAGAGASAYWLDVGTVQGQGNIYAANEGLITSQTVSGIPTNGAAIYVRLWTLLYGNWSYYDYSYAAGGTKAVMITPAPVSTLSGSTVTFTWSAGAGASAYWLDVGTVLGQGNIYAANEGLITSQTVSGIPTNGATIYVRLWTLLNGNWSYYDYTYTAFH